MAIALAAMQASLVTAFVVATLTALCVWAIRHYLIKGLDERVNASYKAGYGENLWRQLVDKKREYALVISPEHLDLDVGTERFKLSWDRLLACYATEENFIITTDVMIFVIPLQALPVKGERLRSKIIQWHSYSSAKMQSDEPANSA